MNDTQCVETSSDHVRVVVVDDHPVVVTGIRHLLAESRFRVVGGAGDRTAGLALIRDLHPDVIILDLRLGDDLAPDICRVLTAAGSAPPILILTGHEDRELLQACLDAGVRGVMFKDIGDAAHLVSALERMINGETVVDGRLQSPLRVARAADEGPVAVLTSREYEMLRLLAKGMTSREISAELYLSVNTVRSYVQALLAKLNANTRIEAVAIARRRRLI